MKTILILLDGLGDRSYKILNHRTPLQAAATPNLDRLAYLGSNDLFHASWPGRCLPSETAHHLLFGYEMDTFPGRGLLEAVGEGVVFDDSDVLCLAHLSGVRWQDGVPVLVRGRDEVEGSANELGRLFGAISPYEINGIRFRLHQTRRNDAVLVGPTVRRDNVDAFDEVSVAAGCLGLLRGKELMTMIVNFADRSMLYGHRLGREERAYLSSDYEPFKLTE